MSDLEGPSGVSEEDKIDSGNSSPRDHSTPVGLIVKYIGQVAELTDSVAENSRKFLEGINSAEFRGETDVEALTVALAEKFDNYVAQLQGRPLPSLCETNKDNYRLAWDATTEIGSQVEEAADQSGLRQQNVELAETCRQLSAALSRSEQMQEKIRQFCTEFAKENLQVEVLQLINADLSELTGVVSQLIKNNPNVLTSEHPELEETGNWRSECALDENMRLMEKCRETQTELNDLKHEMKKALKEREELKEENLMLVSQNAALVEFQEQLTGEKNFLELLLNKVRLEKAAVEGRLDELKCSCKSVEALDAKVKSLLIDGENLMSQVKERDAQIDLLTVELGSLRPELAKYKAEAAELQASRTRIDQQWQERLKMEESENTKLRAQVDSLKSILASDTTVEVIKAKEAEIAQLTEQLERAQTQVAAVKDVQDAFKQQRAALEEAQHEVKRKNGEVSQLEKLLDEHLREREELSGQLQTAIADHNEVVVELREEIAALTKKSPATFKTISNSTQTGVVQSDRRLQEIRAYLDEISQFLLRFEDRQADRTDEDETDERQVLLDGLHKILSRQLKVIEDTLLEDSTLNYIDKEKFARVLAELGEKYDKSIDDLRDGHNEFWSRQMQTARTHSAGLRQLYQAAQATINTQREALTEERQANQQLRQDYTVLLKETEKAKFDAADWRQLAEVARTEVELITTKCSKVEQRLQRQEADLIRYRDGVELRNQDIRKLLIKKIQRRYELQRLERQNKELRYHKNYINSVLGEYQDAERRQEELLDQMGFPRVESKCVIKRKSFKVIATLIRASLKFRSGGQYYRRKLTEMEKVIAQLSSGLNQQVTSDDSKQNASHNVSDIINDTQQSNRSFGADKSAALQPTLTSGSLRPSLLGGVKSQANKSDDFEEMVPIKLASNTH